MEEKIIQGIKCVAKNCEYHKSGDYCAAGSIEVEDSTATSSRDTACKTFVPKSDCCK